MSVKIFLHCHFFLLSKAKVALCDVFKHATSSEFCSNACRISFKCPALTQTLRDNAKVRMKWAEIKNPKVTSVAYQHYG